MITAIDSSVILDVLVGSHPFDDLSEEALRKAQEDGKLIICESVLAEIYPAFRNEARFDEFLEDWELEFVPTSRESAQLAGVHYRKYLERGGKAKRVVADFIIGAHAAVHADRLLARDRGYFSKYFRELKVWDPSALK